MTLPRHAEVWLPGYLRNRWAAIKNGRGEPRRVWLTICDHFEPFWKNRDDAVARKRVERWRKLLPEIADRWRDSAGRRPQYSFFYPEEEYRPEILDLLAELKQAGVGDVEIHLHHDAETEPVFIERMSGFRDLLHSAHGLLRKDSGQVVFGFIHGNWALDNSDGGKWCGLNNEISLLRQLGCYADFTMPAPASVTQPRLVNEIFWAVDDPHKPKSHDHGEVLKPGKPGGGDLLMIQGPFGPRWGEWRVPPRLEAGELAHHNVVTPYRVKRWFDLAPRIGGDMFIKLYSHGAQELASQYLLQDGGLEDIFRMMSAECARRGTELRFATAWEMKEAVIDAAKPV